MARKKKPWSAWRASRSREGGASLEFYGPMGLAGPTPCGVPTLCRRPGNPLSPPPRSPNVAGRLESEKTPRGAGPARPIGRMEATIRKELVWVSTSSSPTGRTRRPSRTSGRGTSTWSRSATGTGPTARSGCTRRTRRRATPRALHWPIAERVGQAARLVRDATTGRAAEIAVDVALGILSIATLFYATLVVLYYGLFWAAM